MLRKIIETKSVLCYTQGARNCRVYVKFVNSRLDRRKYNSIKRDGIGEKL